MTEVSFSNGDLYIGNVRGMIPHGKGKYKWSDGTLYEGDWDEGKMIGKGQTIWPSGAIYDGEVSGCYFHGFGTFTSPDGSVYRGSWRLSIRHGLGRKHYPNSDVYDGSWREGLQEGSGTYYWSNGDMYSGNWKSGRMCGRGVMKWFNGDMFDGFWLNGLKHGSGVYRISDGSYYFGTWTRGLKDGQGRFYPAGYKPPSWGNSDKSDEGGKRLLSHTSSLRPLVSRATKSKLMRSLSDRISINKLSRGSGQISSRNIVVEQGRSIGNFTRELSSFNASEICHPLLDSISEVDDNHAVIYEREYIQGILTTEKLKNSGRQPRNVKQQSKVNTKDAKIRSGVEVFERHKSYYLMLNLQLGIRYTVGKITPLPMREVRRSDFGIRARIRKYFPRKGSQVTPPHYSLDFYWKDYCPMVFRNLREMFQLDAADYMMSICGHDGLREFSSPGKSGSLFYLSHDDRFVIKTLRRTELQVLLKMLPTYYNHVKEYENTLITKFFGVHEITLKGRKKVRFVVMGNMFCTELRIHRRYDLKGSYQGRYTNKEDIIESTTLKDCDLSYEFHMDKSLRESLIEQISLDCMFLKSQQIIDYSLLLGLHFRAPEHLKTLLQSPESVHKTEKIPAAEGEISDGDLVVPPKGLLLVTHEPSAVSIAPGPHIRGNPLRAYSLGDQEVDLLLPETGRLLVQLGVNMPAKANHKKLVEDADNSDSSDDVEVELFEVEVVLYLGIIDILQDYNTKKKLEHAYKSLRFDPMSISSVPPDLYSDRFIKFLEKVFPPKP